MFRPVDFSELNENQKLEAIYTLLVERDEALETIKQRDKENNALKHMLDRKDDEKWDFLLRMDCQFWLKIMTISLGLTYQRQKELSYH